MGTSNFLVFNPNKANMVDDSTYLNSLYRQNGAVSGTAPSNVHNKLYYQTSIGVAALMQALANKGLTLSDADYNTLVAALENITISSQIMRVPVRQTVLYGHVDSNGYADFLQIGTGLAVNLLATSTPLIVTFAYNFDVNYGQIDYIGKVTSDVTGAWSNLPANQSAVFLYIDRNISTGALTYGYSLLEPQYSIIAPTSPAVDQHWFDLNSFYMKCWNGTAWENKQRVFVGECVTGASSITGIPISYALKGQYLSEWFPVAANTNYTKNHNIGIKIPAGLQVQFYFSLDSAGADASFAHDIFVISTNSLGHHIIDNTVQNTRNYIKFGFNTSVQDYKGVSQTSGYYRVFIKRGW